MSDISGRLDIRILRASGSARIQISSSRPVTAARIFAGKTPGEVARTLPMLFSICGTAQASACTMAFERALGIEPTPPVQALRMLLLSAETAKELAWRLLLDWPKALGLAPQTDAMAEVMRAYLGLKAASSGAADPFLPGAAAATAEQPLAARLGDLAAHEALGMAPEQWLSDHRDPEGFLTWAEHSPAQGALLAAALLREDLAALGSNPVTPLDDPPAAVWEALLAGPQADAFVAAPTRDGAARETTPFSRLREIQPTTALVERCGNGLLPRLAALLTTLAQTAALLRDPRSMEPPAIAGDAKPTSAPAGIGTAMAARGLLVHRVALTGGRVASYRILAPTEWNFHPEGVVAAGLRSIAGATPDDAALRRRARLWITAIDPCVDYDLSLS